MKQSQDDHHDYKGHIKTQALQLVPSHQHGPCLMVVLQVARSRTIPRWRHGQQDLRHHRRRNRNRMMNNQRLRGTRTSTRMGGRSGASAISTS